MNTFPVLFEKMISIEALFNAWFAFRKGKAERGDVQEYGRHVERNIFRLHRELIARKYRHSAYSSFFIQDPKARHIRRACVRDRLVHQAVYTVLAQIYEPKLIHHVFSSRPGKGTHLAVKTLSDLTCKVSRNHARTCWALKCDIRKFYDSVDHAILFSLLGKVVKDDSANWLLGEIIESFHVDGRPGKGIPIGNLTSQIFTHVYLNELDQFVKQKLREKYYLRFADDLLILSDNKERLLEIRPELGRRLRQRLRY